MIVTGVVDETLLVDTVKVAVVAPEATVTVEGTVADELLEDRLTAKPLDGAGPLIVTVPVDVPPPVTDVGLRLMPVRAGGVMVSLAVSFTAPRVA